MNTQITEDYVSFETAKLLKEKGFNEPCFAYYYVMPHKTVIAYDTNFPKNSDLCSIYANIEFGSLPTLQMAMKWLKEEYHLYIEIIWDGYYNVEIKSLLGNVPHTPFDYTFDSYEESVEATIKYCLKNLI